MGRHGDSSDPASLHSLRNVCIFGDHRNGSVGAGDPPSPHQSCPKPTLLERPLLTQPAVRQYAVTAGAPIDLILRFSREPQPMQVTFPLAVFEFNDGKVDIA